MSSGPARMLGKGLWEEAQKGCVGGVLGGNAGGPRGWGLWQEGRVGGAATEE